MKIAVVGLGYVGLPLAVALSRKHEVVGFDVSLSRVQALRVGVDTTNEVHPDDLKGASLKVTAQADDLQGCAVFIVTVPTPIDSARRPDFNAILSACETIGPRLRPGAIVVFESTVYPGVTEEICAPALERASGLKAGVDFKLGYSPERINPGDKAHPVEQVIKVVSAQDDETLNLLTQLYGSIISAGVHAAPSIKVAEAAKVIENTQRDLNIALMNEISKICDLLGIQTRDVLAAAGTKWNFLPFHPGLVGGHCIGVDPYYLTAKAEQLGYHPEVILSGRRLNDSMGPYVAQRLVKMLAQRRRSTEPQRIGILGLTFKENVPDIRNSKVIDIYRELQEFGLEPMVHDPLADKDAVKEAYGIDLCQADELQSLDALVYAVPHQPLVEAEDRFSGMIAEGGILIDVRARLDRAGLRDDVRYWSL